MKNLKSVRNTHRLSVDCNVEDGLKYFVIYEVVARKLNGEFVVTGRYLKEDDAKYYSDYNYRLKSLYNLSFYRKQLVWC